MKTGAELIAEERQRQIEVEGWTKEHDAQHKNGELAKAAICYADPNTYYHQENKIMMYRVPNRFWPKKWDIRWFKPTDRIRDLVKAGALIAAEIDRLQLEKKNEQKPSDNVEPKFKIGDIIINKKSKDTVKIVQILQDSYCYTGWDGAATVHSDFNISEQDNWELVEQNPVWSEEDEEMCYKVTAVINKLCAEGKEYVWSINTLNKLFYWLKSLKDRMQPKVKWSKEDKDRYLSCLQRLSTGNPEQPETINSKWFKEHVYLQSTWKPTKEQIRRLEYFVKLWGKTEDTENTKVLETIKSLLNDLKQL